VGCPSPKGQAPLGLRMNGYNEAFNETLLPLLLVLLERCRHLLPLLQQLLGPLGQRLAIVCSRSWHHRYRCGGSCCWRFGLEAGAQVPHAPCAHSVLLLIAGQRRVRPGAA
jgi:hypothetical protein